MLTTYISIAIIFCIGKPSGGEERGEICSAVVYRTNSPPAHYNFPDSIDIYTYSIYMYLRYYGERACA